MKFRQRYKNSERDTKVLSYGKALFAGVYL